MTYELEFYRDEDGQQPALDYIRSQIRKHRTQIGRALDLLEKSGHLARRPLVDYVGNDLYELRAPIERHQHRLLYFFHERTIIVVTSGFMKNMDKIPETELARARRRRADWLRRFGGRS